MFFLRRLFAFTLLAIHMLLSESIDFEHQMDSMLKANESKITLSINLDDRFKSVHFYKPWINNQPSALSASLSTSSSSIVSVYSLEVLQAEYEKLIASCLGRISTGLEKCVQEFNATYRKSWIVKKTSYEENKSSPREKEKIRQFCCIQNDFKECWIRAIRRHCSDQERLLSRWLPVMVLQDLRYDSRCSNYVLYPHKCLANSLNLWQIFTFLILVPFATSISILGLILYCFPSRFINSRDMI